MFDVLLNENTSNELAEENPSLLKKLLRHIKAFIADIKAIIAQLGSKWEEVKALSKDHQALESIRWLMESALLQIDIASQSQKNTATGDGVIKFSLMNDASFEDNIDNIIDMNDEDAIINKKESNFIRIMYDTPSVVLENKKGSENNEVIIRFDALYLATRNDGVLDGHYHNLGKEVMKNLPHYLSVPDAIVRMNNGRINILQQ